MKNLAAHASFRFSKVPLCELSIVSLTNRPKKNLSFGSDNSVVLKHESKDTNGI